MKNPNCITAFSDQLRSLRKAHNLSQQKLADNSGIEKKTLQNIEMNRHNPSLDVLCSIAKGLDIPLKDLLDFEYSESED